MKKVTALFLLLAMLTFPSFAYNSDEMNQTHLAEIEQALIDQQPAYRATIAFYEKFDKDSNGLEIYPDDYCGGYYSPEDKKFHIKLLNFDNLNHYKNMANSEYIAFELGNNSYNDLLSLGKEIPAVDSGYEFHGIDEKENLAVFAKKPSSAPKTIKSISSISNAQLKAALMEVKELDQAILKLPVLLEDYSEIEQETSLMGGQNIVNPDASLSCTLGICGYWNGKEAILTAGHCGTPKQSVTFNGTKIGQFVESVNNTSIGKDYGIVYLTTRAYPISAKVLSQTSTTGTVTISDTALVKMGYKLRKYGYVSGEALVEVVRATPGTIYKAKVLSGTSTKGDSGGPYHTSLSTGGPRVFVGIHSASDISNGVRYVYFTPTDVLPTSFKVLVNPSR
ncbi:chymotrypsin family serine protease [Guggenheimella bovis]